MTEKQKNFIRNHGLDIKISLLGLNPDSLTVQQASDIIAKFYKDQEKHNKMSKPVMSTQEKSIQEKEDELDKLFGQKFDYDRYPECGFDRSWAGS